MWSKAGAHTEIVGTLGREANAFIANRAREADRKIEQAEHQEALANENELMSVEQRQALRETATELRSQAQALNSAPVLAELRALLDQKRTD